MTKKLPTEGYRGKKLTHPRRSHRASYDRSMVRRAWHDQRSVVSQVLHANHEELVANLGGLENLSYQQLSLCDRAIMVEARLNLMERRMLEGQEELEGSYAVLVNVLIGLYKTLGIQRQSRTVSLDDYAKEVADAN